MTPASSAGSVVSVIVLLTLGPGVSRADAPLPPPATVEAASPHGSCLARSDPSPALTSVRRPGGPILWSVRYWTPNPLVSDDCAVLGLGYDRGSLLVPVDKQPGTPVMMFYRAGRPARTVRLGDIYPDLSVLPRTSSHFLWHTGTDWSGTAWTARTVDGRTVSFMP